MGGSFVKKWRGHHTGHGSLNLEVRRIHSDRAGELASKANKRWCAHRGILHGRAESEVGMVRRGVTVLLKALKLDEDHWPMLARQEEQVMQAAEEVFLQTRMISLLEVKRNLSDWLPSMKGELENFTSNQAIQRVTKAEADAMMAEAKAAGKVVEMIPAIRVFSRKAGAGKRKSRIVCCGNYMADRSADELYASGADSTQVRAILRKSALESWDILSLDIRSAFLLAPTSQDELIIVQPPRILYDAGLIDHDEVWVVTEAMYGLTTAPRDWASHRDNQLRHLRWTQVILGEERKLGLVPLADPNLWVVKEWKADGKGGVLVAGPPLGYLAVYVDDLLVVAERSTAEKLAQVLDATWPAGPPEYVEAGGPAMKFLGMEIQKSEKGDIEVHQHCYAQELLQRNGVVARATHIKVPEEKEDPAPALRTVRETRPDLAAAVQRMSSRATRNPEWVLELGANVLAYLSTSWEKKLVYTKEVPVDVSRDGKVTSRGTLCTEPSSCNTNHVERCIRTMPL